MYSLGAHSLSELEGVHPDLKTLVHTSINTTEQDFTVHDGLRTIAEQEEYVARGVSKTMNSMHMRQPDGFGHAVDLVPYINGKLRWEMNACLVIASAMQRAARDLAVPLRWGGCWERIDNTSASPEELMEVYIERRRKEGRRPFLDGPHFELA